MLITLLMTLQWLSPGSEVNSPEVPLEDPIQSYQEQVPGTDLKLDWVAIPVGEKNYPKTMSIGSPASEKERK